MGKTKQRSTEQIERRPVIVFRDERGRGEKRGTTMITGGVEKDL